MIQTSPPAKVPLDFSRSVTPQGQAYSLLCSLVPRSGSRLPPICIASSDQLEAAEDLNTKVHCIASYRDSAIKCPITLQPFVIPRLEAATEPVTKVLRSMSLRGVHHVSSCRPSVPLIAPCRPQFARGACLHRSRTLAFPMLPRGIRECYTIKRSR